MTSETKYYIEVKLTNGKAIQCYYDKERWLYAWNDLQESFPKVKMHRYELKFIKNKN